MLYNNVMWLCCASGSNASHLLWGSDPLTVQAEPKEYMQTRAHAAAALANIEDVTLLRGIGCFALTQTLEEASADLEVSLHEDCHA